MTNRIVELTCRCHEGQIYIIDDKWIIVKNFDRNARLIQPYLEKELGVPVIVENRPGAGSEIACTYLFREPGDGYVILQNLWEYLAFSTILRTPMYLYEDIVPLIVHYGEPRILIVRKDSPFNNLADIIEAAKREPGKLAVSTDSTITLVTTAASTLVNCEDGTSSYVITSSTHILSYLDLSYTVEHPTIVV